MKLALNIYLWVDREFLGILPKSLITRQKIIKTHVGQIGTEFHSLEGYRKNVCSNLGYQGMGKT